MRFSFEDKQYIIEFKRAYREYPHTDLESGLQLMRKSAHPYTTVTVFEVNQETPLDKKVFRTATVGCHPGDKFSLEKGRCRALRLATITLPLQMKPILWAAYHNRRQVNVVHTSVETPQPVMWKAYHERPRPVSKPKDLPTPTVGAGDGDSSASVGSPTEA